MKHKKLWITLSIILAVIILFIIVVAVAFRLKHVDVEFRQRADETMLSQGIQNEVLESARFDFGKNILFMDVSENIARIEKAHPYVKVEQVIRYFPNTLRVYISERTPKYRVRNKAVTTEETWFILDNEFKVLDMVTKSQLENEMYENYTIYNNTIMVTSDTMSIYAELGDFVKDFKDKQGYLETISSAYRSLKNSYDLIYSISITANDDGELEFRMILGSYNYCTILVTGTKDLKEKFKVGVDYYFKQDNTTNGSTIVVKKSGSGYIAEIQN